MGVIPLYHKEVHSNVVPTLKHLICEKAPSSDFREPFDTLSNVLNEIGTGPFGGDAIKIFPQAFPDDVAAFFLTSGSTGISKVAVHTHASLIATGRRINSAFKLYVKDAKYFGILPLNFMGGYPNYFFSNLVPICYLEPEVDIKQKEDLILSAIDSEHCTSSYFPHKVMHSILTRNEIPHLGLQTLCTGGVTIPLSFAQACGTLTNELVVGYGSTESGFVICRPIRNVSDCEAYNCGKPCEGVEFKFADEHGNDVTTGRTGELYLRDKNMFCGYFNRPEKYEAVMTPDGWYKTGDFGHVRENGDIFVKGRINDLHECSLNRFDVSVCPADIEAIVKKNKDISDVFAVVFPEEGTGNPQFYACVESEKALLETDLVIFLEENSSGSFDAHVRFIVLCKFPRTPTGKVSRFEMNKIVLAHKDRK